MPRGYLKHKKEAGRRKSRGGGSHSSGSCRTHARNDPDKSALVGLQSTQPTTRYPDFAIPSCQALTIPKKKNESIDYPISECPICFEVGPVISLSKKNCGWHDAACFGCLRRLYVTDAQKDVRNYPLCCFHPQCRHPIQIGQLEKHNLFQTHADYKGYHRMMILKKAQQSAKGAARTVYCPSCDMPRIIRSRQQQDQMHSCQNCCFRYRVSPDYATVRAMERMGQDTFGENEGIARCPGCGILLSKGDGCDHMTCPCCNHEFSWEQAVEDFGTLARPKDEDIYMWW